MKPFLKLIAFNAFVLLCVYFGAQHYMNKDAKFHAGDCFISKSIGQLFSLQINGVHSGRYQYTLFLIITQVDKEEEILKFEGYMKDNFIQANCETGQPL